MKRYSLLFLSFLMISVSFAQRKVYQSLEEPILADSASTLMIPVEYNSGVFSYSKSISYSKYCANIIFYDFQKDSSRKLFPVDTYIKDIKSNFPWSNWNTHVSKHPFGGAWIFYFVKTTDYNGNGRIDDNDPSILYISDRYGKGLKPVSPSDENILEIHIYDKQGFALLKMQKDSNKDRNFQSSDLDHYYVKLDLKTLALGNKIGG